MELLDTYIMNSREVGAVIGAICGVVFAGASLLALAAGLLLAGITGLSLAWERVRAWWK